MSDHLVVENLAKRYGAVEAVRNVSFGARGGEIFGLLGPNGAGKTTTIECIIGLRTPDGGTVRIAGFDAVAEPEKVKQCFGVALQSTALQDKITPREALHLFGSFYRRKTTPQHLIERFDLHERADAPFQSLSHGQRQRLALALAFVNEPDLVFLDEPTSGLDPQSRRELYSAIVQMRVEGRAVVLTTHYIEEAEKLCDRVAIIDRGRIIAAGSPAELVAASRALSHVAFKAAAPPNPDRLGQLPGVVGVEINGDGARLKTSTVSQTVIDLVRMLQSDGIELTDLHIHRPSLEDVFIELTGSELRD